MRPCGRQGRRRKPREAKLRRGWPNIQGWRMYELGKYIISLKEENEAVVLRYADCGKHFGIFFQSDGSRRFDWGRKRDGGSIGDVSTFCFKLAVCACQCIRFLSPPTVLRCSELAEPRLSTSRHGFFRLVTNWRE